MENNLIFMKKTPNLALDINDLTKIYPNGTEALK